MPQLSSPYVSWPELAARLRASEGPVAWCWIASRDYQGRWVPLLWTIRSATEITPRSHYYPDHAISCTTLSPANAADQFLVGRIGSVQDSDLAIEPPEQQRLSATWRTTETAHHSIAVGPWPYLIFEWEGSPPMGQNVSTWGELTAPDAPFFVSPQAAAAELLLGLPYDAVRQETRGRLILAIPDRRGAIDPLSFAEGTTRIQVRSARPAELAGGMLRVTWRPTTATVNAERHDIPLIGETHREYAIRTGGVPHELWAILVAPDGTVLDRHGWQANYGDRPAETHTQSEQIERWLSESEHEQLEYKQQLGKENNDAFAKDVCAFANTAGGVVLIGVADDAEVVGYPPAEFSRVNVADQITQVLADRVAPRPPYDYERVEVRGKPVWVVRVRRGGDRPYEISDVPYVRDNAISRAAKRDEQLRLLSPSPDPLSALR